MIFYIVVGLVFLGWLVICYKLIWRDSFSDGVEKVILPLLFAILAACLAGLLGLVLLIPAHIVGDHYKESWRVDLQQISMGSKTQGSFFLGSGYVDGVLTYNYYVKNNDGSFYADSVPAYMVSVVESDETPHMQRYTKNWSDKIFPTNFLGTGWDLTDYDHWYVIYVPKGSIKQNINMDLPSN